ncbi:MAG: hypothetical protein HQL95_13270 [Magnetococcales bacterium]|nr:hypothetical protein [Magnetococcales bacterium]
MKENEILINEWAPIHLAAILKKWFWKDDVKEVVAQNVWQQCCQQLYLPRLKDDKVFQATLAAGSASKDFFGFAQGREENRFIGFRFGEHSFPVLDTSLLLIEPGTATAYAEELRKAEQASTQRKPIEPQPDPPIDGPTGVAEQPGRGYKVHPLNQIVKKQFYGSIELDPIQAKRQFVDLVDEVVMQFTSRPGVQVKITIEIQAQSATGFDDGLQRSVKENCNVLRFKNAEFEEEDQ